MRGQLPWVECTDVLREVSSVARLRDGKEGGNTCPGICQPELGVGKGGLGEFERLCKEEQRFLLGMGAWAGSG